MYAAETEWCSVCCTSHDDSSRCPGDVEATGEEAIRYRSMYLTPRGWEIYAVLVAPARDIWRARIASLPRTLWTVPGGAKTMKFLGVSGEAVRRAAIEYIEHHCRKLGYEPIDEVTVRDPEDGNADPLVHRRDGRHAPRKNALLWAMWGVDEPREEARTFNLSVDGLFLVTSDPEERGKQIKILLNAGEEKVQLAGTVVWTRQDSRQGRPTGMGVLLNRPPDCYVEYVRRLH